MNDVALKDFLIDHVLNWLREGNYVTCTYKYMGSYWDAKDGDKIERKNVKFVNYPEVRTSDGKTIQLQRIMTKLVVEGELKKVFTNVGIDTDDWTIYMSIPTI